GRPATGWTLFWTAYPPANVVPPPPPFYEPLAHPYLDAPPLFAWIAGAAAWLDGDRTLLDTIHDPGPRLVGIALAIIAAALAIAPGLAVGVSAAILLASRRQFRLAAVAGGAALGGQALVLLYSATQDWHVYTELARLRGMQLSALNGYRFIAASMGFDHQQMFDGWWLLGWLGLAELLSR